MQERALRGLEHWWIGDRFVFFSRKAADWDANVSMATFQTVKFFSQFGRVARKAEAVWWLDWVS